MKRRRIHWPVIALFSAAAALISACALSGHRSPESGESIVRSKESRRPDMPYVPTPPYVVEEMLEIARVGPNDIVYDLGCGDGRIIITAALKHGVRGVGTLTAESQENIKKGRVMGNLVRFTGLRKIKGKSVRLRYEGRIDGHRIEGVISTPGLTLRKKWIAERDPATAVPLDRPIPGDNEPKKELIVLEDRISF